MAANVSKKMPKPNTGESENHFVERCIPIVINEGTTNDSTQAAAICHSIYREGKQMITAEHKKAQHYAVKSCYYKDGVAIKDVDTVGRVVTGFYNTFNYVDSDGDVLIMGSAKKTIKERGVNSTAIAKIKHALNHNLSLLPGKIVVLEEKEINGLSGIYFETKMANTTIGNDTLQNYLEKIYDNHSIGFQYMQVEMIDTKAKDWQKWVDNLINPEDAIKREMLWIVKEIALFEGSTVAFGANKLTPFLGVKSGNKDSMRLALCGKVDAITNTLKNGTQSDEMMEQLELQCLQFKQMIVELTENITLNKSTERPDEEAEAEVAPIDYKFLTSNLKLK